MSAEEQDRQGMRGHDENGNVRPADGRYGLHVPEDEGRYVGPAAPEAKRNRKGKADG